MCVYSLLLGWVGPASADAALRWVASFRSHLFLSAYRLFPIAEGSSGPGSSTEQPVALHLAWRFSQSSRLLGS
jgi:hypothetical protein